ncbi:KDP operon transcriptional regulatory protein KdpE [Peptococcaceae bacterium CEB3]|nr:KDP operon transcriptional regulatory protein KdpE [Peptococcaceae bacterium CEB3]
METSKIRVLVIDDEVQIRRLLKVALTAHGYDVYEAGTGQSGLNWIAMHKPDLVLLDLGLPDQDGLEVIKNLREWSQVPVVILSAREQESEKIAALDAGADDYVTKPFSMGELLARLRAALRHASEAAEEPLLTFDGLSIDRSRRVVAVDGVEVKLTPTEYELMKVLAANAGKVLTHRQLLRAVWGPAYEHENHYLRIYVGQLRRKIEPDPSRPRHILTEAGVGYRLV